MCKSWNVHASLLAENVCLQAEKQIRAKNANR